MFFHHKGNRFRLPFLFFCKIISLFSCICGLRVFSLHQQITNTMKNTTLILIKTVKFNNECTGVKLQAVQIGTMTIYHQKTPLYGVRENDEIFLAYQSAKGDYLVPVLFGSQTNFDYIAKAYKLFAHRYTWTIEINGSIQIVKMTEREFDYKFGKYQDGYNFSIINKGA